MWHLAGRGRGELVVTQAPPGRPPRRRSKAQRRAPRRVAVLRARRSSTSAEIFPSSVTVPTRTGAANGAPRSGVYRIHCAASRTRSGKEEVAMSMGISKTCVLVLALAAACQPAGQPTRDEPGSCSRAAWRCPRHGRRPGGSGRGRRGRREGAGDEWQRPYRARNRSWDCSRHGPWYGPWYGSEADDGHRPGRYGRSEPGERPGAPGRAPAAPVPGGAGAARQGESPRTRRSSPTRTRPPASTKRQTTS